MLYEKIGKYFAKYLIEHRLFAIPYRTELIEIKGDLDKTKELTIIIYLCNLLENDFKLYSDYELIGYIMEIIKKLDNNNEIENYNFLFRNKSNMGYIIFDKTLRTLYYDN